MSWIRLIKWLGWSLIFGLLLGIMGFVGQNLVLTLWEVLR